MPTLPEPPLRWRRHAAGLPAPGALVGGYRLAEPLGPGRPHCLIFEARAPDGRSVAIQLLSSVLSSDAAFRRRFRRLMRARAAIDHPRVVPIIKSGRSPHGLYVVLASYPTVSLGGLLEERRPETSLTVKLLTQAASALIAAEAHGLVHDDLTPRSIGIDAAGALLADFGVSARGSDDAPLGWLDLRYASPEQHLGRPLTPRSNVHSLGCILYECLTGAPPFGAVTGLSQLALPRPRVTDRRPDLSPAIDAAVGVAMAKLPQRRYATAAGLATAASAALESGDGPEWDEVAEAINAGTRLDLAGRQPRRAGARGRPFHARPPPADAAAERGASRPGGRTRACRGGGRARAGTERADGAAAGRAQPAPAGTVRSRRAPFRARGKHPAIGPALAIALVVGVVAAGAGGYLAGRSEPGGAERASPPQPAAAQGAEVRADQHFSGTVDTALARLDTERLVARRRLASATTPALQTAAAERLARAYGSAAGRVAVVAALDPAGPRLLASLRAGQSAYAGLAVAARRGRRDAFARGRATVEAAERGLEQAVLARRRG